MTRRLYSTMSGWGMSQPEIQPCAGSARLNTKQDQHDQFESTNAKLNKFRFSATSRDTVNM